MFVVQIDFTHATGEVDSDAATDLVNVWWKNGQFAAFPDPMARVDSGIRVTGLVYEPDALDAKHANGWVRRETEVLRDAGVEIRTSLVGPDVAGDTACDCAGVTEYILFTTYLAVGSPLRCGACFGEVPLYRVPRGPSDEHLDLLQWMADYQACDTLQMHCTVGERFGERQLREWDSALSRLARELAADIVERTGVPVFTYLHRMHGRSLAAERRRPCPGCGAAWLLDEQLHGRFDQRCEACHLLGNLAADVT